MSLSQSFNQIYKTNTWGDGSLTKPHSGRGSIPDNAQPYVDFVRKVIHTYKLKKVLDVGHGDFKMWRDWQFPGIDYLGVDISDEATRVARSNYPNLNFITLDLVQAKTMPSSDILISKDCLQHLPNHTILMLLRKFSNYEFLIICNSTLLPFESWTAKLRFYGRIRSRIRAFLSLRSPFFLVHRKNNVDIEILYVPTLKPLDHKTISLSLKKNDICMVLCDRKYESQDYIYSKNQLLKSS